LDLNWIASKSLINCHTVGVDSVVFDDTSGKVVRAFIANENHNLYFNSPWSNGPLSVALHAHHCDVTLKPIFGNVWNITPGGAMDGQRYAAYKYQSTITTGHGSFIRGDEGDDMLVRLREGIVRCSIKLPAAQVHSVCVLRGKLAAWWVYEGAEDPNYNGTCWSDDDLSNFDFAPLYKPMSVDYLKGVLNMIGLPR
jgi:hypothetical protein